MDFYKKVLRTARKQHWCDFCGQEIKAGEKYSYESWRDGGDFCQSRLCLVCRNMFDQCIKEEEQEEFTHDYVAEWLYDKYCYYCEHCKNCEYYDSDVQNCPIIRKHFESLESD